MERLNTLTSLRFFAAVGVLFTHTGVHLALPASLFLLTTRGESGVSFFFLLSGFILTYVYSRRFSGEKLKREQYVDFLRARFARIYPMHVVGLLLMTLSVGALLVLFPQHREDLHLTFSPSRMAVSWLANLVLVQSYVPTAGFRNFWNAPSWSLATEAAFYLLFPWVFRTIVKRLESPKKALLVCILSVILDIVLRVAVYHLIDRHFQGMRRVQFRQVTDQFFGMRFWEFLLGCCLASLYFHLPSGKISVNTRAILFVCSVLALVVFGLMPSVSKDAFNLMSIPLFGVLVFSAVSPGARIESIIASKPLVLLGEASFSLYITHWPFLKLLEGMETAGIHMSPFVYWAFFPFMFGVSILCFKTIEGPMRSLLHPTKIAPKLASS